MAIMVPSDPKDFNSTAEKDAYLALQHSLPNSVTVFYSLRWLHPGEERGVNDEGKNAQGEGDFVIFDPAKGIMVIEVKGGDIWWEQGQFFQTNRGTEFTKRIWPEEQAEKTELRLRGEVRTEVPAASSLLFCRAVWFPYTVVNRKKLPPHCPSEIVLDQHDVDEPNLAIERAFQYWGKAYPWLGGIHPKHKQEVLEALAPSLEMVPSVKAIMQQHDAQLVRLTREQARIVNFLDEQQHAAVHGAAGTGKTLIALEKARRLASRGEKVLFLCYSELLKLHLQQHYEHPDVHFTNFHSFALEIAPSKSLEDAERALIRYLDEEKPLPYSHLIIDEGQDFESEWLEWLNYRFRDMTFYVFYDRNQLVHDGDLRWLEAMPCRLVLSVNCRNTYEIGRVSHRAVGLTDPSRRITGPLPVLHPVESDAEAVKLTQELLQTVCVEQQIEAHRVAVLTLMDPLGKDSPFREIRLAGEGLPRNPVQGRVTMTTARRFKGLEATFIIVPDVDFRRADDEEWRRRLYVACSRAQQAVHLISTVTEEQLGPAVQAFGGKAKARPSWADLSDLLRLRLRQQNDPNVLYL